MYWPNRGAGVSDPIVISLNNTIPLLKDIAFFFNTCFETLENRPFLALKVDPNYPETANSGLRATLVESVRDGSVIGVARLSGWPQPKSRNWL